MPDEALAQRIGNAGPYECAPCDPAAADREPCTSERRLNYQGALGSAAEYAFLRRVPSLGYGILPAGEATLLDLPSASQ
jgi:hypothetical protein